MHHRYTINNTSANFNLTKIDQPPTLGRSALLALAEWMLKRSKAVELNGMGKPTAQESLTLDQSIGTNRFEKNENGSKTGSINQ